MGADVSDRLIYVSAAVKTGYAYRLDREGIERERPAFLNGASY
jgi:hypothetical protein